MRAPTHHSFTFNLRFLYALKHKFRLSKNVCGIFHFRFRFALLKLYFCSTKCMDSFTLDNIIPFKIKIIEKPPRVLLPVPLILKLQQEVLKFSDICVSWSSPKIDQVTHFLIEKIKILRRSIFLNRNF